MPLPVPIKHKPRCHILHFLHVFFSTFDERKPYWKYVLQHWSDALFVRNKFRITAGILQRSFEKKKLASSPFDDVSICWRNCFGVDPASEKLRKVFKPIALLFFFDSWFVSTVLTAYPQYTGSVHGFNCSGMVLAAMKSITVGIHMSWHEVISRLSYQSSVITGIPVLLNMFIGFRIKNEPFRKLNLKMLSETPILISPQPRKF